MYCTYCLSTAHRYKFSIAPFLLLLVEILRGQISLPSFCLIKFSPTFIPPPFFSKLPEFPAKTVRQFNRNTCKHTLAKVATAYPCFTRKFKKGSSGNPMCLKNFAIVEKVKLAEDGKLRLSSCSNLE